MADAKLPQLVSDATKMRTDTILVNDRMRHWDAMARPPASALKTIKGGRLQGMTDVNPQWRYQAMTEQFGMIGFGWKYEIDKIWTDPGADDEVLAFAQVSVRVRDADNSWSEPIIGIGGNHLIVKEKGGLHNNDEAWKMAVTDALSVALKMIGVAADIYAGAWDGSKYIAASAAEKRASKVDPKAKKEALTRFGELPEAMRDRIEKAFAELKLTEGQRLARLNQFLMRDELTTDDAAKELLEWCKTEWAAREHRVYTKGDANKKPKPEAPATGAVEFK